MPEACPDLEFAPTLERYEVKAAEAQVTRLCRPPCCTSEMRVSKSTYDKAIFTVLTATWSLGKNTWNHPSLSDGWRIHTVQALDFPVLISVCRNTLDTSSVQMQFEALARCS